jgi:ABC-type glycerol-3-phosphate transport system substrate-binding protein
MSFQSPRVRPRYLGLACVVACLLGFSLSGCAVLAPAPEPVTITFSYSNYYTNAKKLEVMVDEFSEQYPYITVELLPHTFYRSLTYPGDVNVAYSWDTLEKHMQGKIAMMDLTTFIEQEESLDLADFYPGVMDFFSIEGKTLAIPTGVDVEMLYYNKGLFDRYGVSYPEAGWTWDDFLDAAIALRDPNAGIYGFGANPDGWDYVDIIYSRGGQLFDDLQEPTRTMYDDPKNIEALEWYVGLSEEYDVAPTREQVQKEFRGYVYNGITMGKVGMWIGEFSERQGYNSDWGFEWDMVPLPSEEGTPTLGWWEEGLFISGEAQHPDACWKWIVFLCERNLPEFLMPVRKSLVESEKYEQAVGFEIADIALDSIEKVSPVGYGAQELITKLDQGVDMYFSGTFATPQEALVWAQKRVR